jgi:hypothetical protein
LNIDRALRAVTYAWLRLTALALVMLVRFEVGFKSIPSAIVYLVIVVLLIRTGGFIRAVVVSGIAIAYLNHAFVPLERQHGTQAVGLAPFLTRGLVTTCLVSR